MRRHSLFQDRFDSTRSAQMELILPNPGSWHNHKLQDSRNDPLQCLQYENKKLRSSLDNDKHLFTCMNLHLKSKTYIERKNTYIYIYLNTCRYQYVKIWIYIYVKKIYMYKFVFVFQFRKNEVFLPPRSLSSWVWF